VKRNPTYAANKTVLVVIKYVELRKLVLIIINKTNLYSYLSVYFMDKNMRYKRMLEAGACYFFTVNLEDRSQPLLVENIELLRRVYSKVAKKHPIKTIAIVIMPDHLHAIWQLPKGDSNYAMRWRLIKSGFSRELPATEFCNKSRIAKGERGIWQRRYWEHKIRDEEDLNNHINYIHYNPVKHNHVIKVSDWPFSSFHQYVKNSKLSQDWECNNDSTTLYDE
jgi:putative transposase